MAFKLEPKVYVPDCTGQPERWPCGTGLEVVVAPGSPCVADGCDGVTTGKTQKGDLRAFAPFCPRCRHRGRMAISRGHCVEDSVVEWLRVGVRGVPNRRAIGRAA